MTLESDMTKLRATLRILSTLVVAHLEHLFDWAGKALCGALSDWQGRGSQPPTPTPERPAAVQPDPAQDQRWHMGAPLGIEQYRAIAAADPARAELLAMIEQQQLINRPDIAEWYEREGFARHHVNINGSRGLWVWVDTEGCSPMLDIHQRITLEHWHRYRGRLPECSHFKDKTTDAERK